MGSLYGILVVYYLNKYVNKDPPVPSARQNQFLSHSIYSTLIPFDNPWDKLNNFIDWNKFGVELSDIYKNNHGGNSNYSPVMMLKILFLQYIFNGSDRRMEELVSYDIRIKYFLRLEINTTSPDYSTVNIFRNTVLKVKGEIYFKKLFEHIVSRIKEEGMEFGSLTNLDSTIVNADVNTMKEKIKKEKAKDKGDEPPECRDEDASWTAKSRPKTDKNGNKYSEIHYYYGYKMHTAVNENDIITSIIPLSAKSSDNNEALDLLTQTLENGINILYAGGDKGYDDAVLIKMIEDDLNIMACIKTKRSRTKKGDLNQQFYWENYASNMERKEIQKKRGYVERVYADMKSHHGLSKSKYIGLSKFKMQSYLTASVHNIKIAFKSIWGLSFRII